MWTLTLSILGYSLYHFARDRWGLFADLSLGRMLARIKNLWHNLFIRVQRTLSDAARQLSNRRLRQDTVSDVEGRWPPFSLRRMSPRQRVRYIYLSLLRRASAEGLARAPSDTPLEYLKVLQRNLSDVEEQVQLLTESFVEARYSEHDVDNERAGLVNRLWRRVRRALGDWDQNRHKE